MIVAMSGWVRELRCSGEVVGALAQGGVALLPENMDRAELEHALDQAERHLSPPPEVSGQEVVLVDDYGCCPVAAVVAVAALRELGAVRVILAGPRELLDEMHEVVDGLIPGRPASPETPTASEMSPRT
jgi:hypothetical protein